MLKVDRRTIKIKSVSGWLTGEQSYECSARAYTTDTGDQEDCPTKNIFGCENKEEAKWEYIRWLMQNDYSFHFTNDSF